MANAPTPFVKKIVLVLLLASSAALAAQPDRFSNVVVEVTALTESIYLLTGAGGNLAVSAGPDRHSYHDSKYT